MKSLRASIAELARDTGEMLNTGQFKNSGEAWEHFAQLLEKSDAVRKAFSKEEFDQQVAAVRDGASYPEVLGPRPPENTAEKRAWDAARVKIWKALGEEGSCPDGCIPPDLERMILLFLKEKRLYGHGKGVAMTNGDGYMLAEIVNHLARLKSSSELPSNILLAELKFTWRELDATGMLLSEQTEHITPEEQA